MCLLKWFFFFAWESACGNLNVGFAKEEGVNPS